MPCAKHMINLLVRAGCYVHQLSDGGRIHLGDCAQSFPGIHPHLCQVG